MGEIDISYIFGRNLHDLESRSIAITSPFSSSILLSSLVFLSVYILYTVFHSFLQPVLEFAFRSLPILPIVGN